MAATLSTQLVANYIATSTPQLRGDLIEALTSYLEDMENAPAAHVLTDTEQAAFLGRLRDFLYALGG